MSTWFVSRHPGALQWMRAHGPAFERHVTHLEESDFQQLGSGDIVIGSLPVHLAARVCARGAQYWNLSLNMPASARGKELSADEQLSAEHYAVGFRTGEQALADQVTATLQEMAADGTVEALCDKYAEYGISFDNWVLK